MRTRTLLSTLFALPAVALLGLPLFSTTSAPAPGTHQAMDGKYIGAGKCKSCHSDEKSGDAYGTWAKAKHAHAFETLASPEAKKVAEERGLGDPQKADECLRCHETAFGVEKDRLARGFKQELGVQCEVCHGPGQDHMKARFAGAASAPVDGYQPLPEGEMIVSPGVDTCTACHNPESPSYKPFCFYEMRAKVSHLNPLKPRTDEETANYGKCPCGAGDPCPHAKDGCPEGVCNLTAEQLAEHRK